MTISIDEDIRLELTEEKHAAGLYDAVDKNRVHLAEFLSWVDYMQSVDDFTGYIKNCESLYQQKKEVSFVIIFQETIAGRIGLHHLDLQHKNASIGYWLAANEQGKGIITKSCKALITYGFQNLGLNRIEIRAAAENSKSRAIPERLNFTQEGILRQAELVNNNYLDLVVYSILDGE